MLGISANLRYYLCCGAIDMRNGFDGLAGIVRNHLKKDPVSGDVFIFLNKTLNAMATAAYEAHQDLIRACKARLGTLEAN